MNITNLLDNLWQDYTTLNPSALRIHDMFLENGESTIHNDHIAFRTYQSEKVGLETLASHFKKLGYKECSDYHFEEKKLYAKHFEHENPELPKIFISEILLKEFSQDAQSIVKNIIDRIDDNIISQASFLYSGRTWDISHEEYNQLKSESEYLAWLSVFGFRANHFTVSINHLKTLKDIREVNTFLKQKGIQLNSSGGEIKGTPEVFLEQSSTLSFNQDVQFIDGSYTVPTTYYEFAQRHRMQNNELYSGFVAKSADKIFESTSKGQ